MKIAGQPVGLNHPVYVVAEMSANHLGRFDQAVRILEAAKAAGADAVKLQTYTADSMTLPLRRKIFRVGGGMLWSGRHLYDLYQEAATPWEWQPKLKAIADRLDIHLFSTPFDARAVAFLERLRVPAYKIASFELVDLPLIRRAARTGKPLIMSTGMATLPEIADAVEAARGAGARDLMLLKCTSAYPAPTEESNLRTLPHLRQAFGTEVGLSDHTLGLGASVAAVALGAVMLERHLTISRAAGGVDAAFSLEPEEFKRLVDEVRRAHKALGSVRYGLTAGQKNSAALRRSLFVVADVPRGGRLNARNVRAIRPGLGLAPKYLEQVLGKRVNRPVRRGTPLSWDILGG